MTRHCLGEGPTGPSCPFLLCVTADSDEVSTLLCKGALALFQKSCLWSSNRRSQTPARHWAGLTGEFWGKRQAVLGLKIGHVFSNSNTLPPILYL